MVWTDRRRSTRELPWDLKHLFWATAEVRAAPDSSRSSSGPDRETSAVPSSFPLVEAEVPRAETSVAVEVHYVAAEEAAEATR